ncbi:vWA domain-containing protein [Yinghuangia sp. YIM S10712]|uniref:vWA domain-containing protein n=1 Tax=Yinghuangia sp. YIM S10712 TaxID=3436930 RepID=UPI003F535718
MPGLLDAARPDVLLIELPADLQDWIPWLAHEETQAPVALAGSGAHGLGFYPFADFSPELAAVRWAARNQVPVLACDLPLAHRGWAAAGPDDAAPAQVRGGPGLHDMLGRNLSGRPGDDLWDRLVEAAAPGSTPEAVRRAALMVGWALRRDAELGRGVDRTDLVREAWMRRTLREATADGSRAVAVVGAFHTPALLAEDDGTALLEAAVAPSTRADGVVTSLVPYTYALLDERSGYPAGIRDPEWQHEVYAAAGDPEALHDTLTRAATRICAELRGQGHPSGPADAREIVRVAGDLARLRGLPAAGRGELLEAVQTVLTHGESLGRGRAVARALERVLVGTRVGCRAPAAPRSGLGPAVEQALADLGLPGPHSEDTAEERDMRLDPLRTDLDRRRELLLKRLEVCKVPYAEAVDVVGTGGADAVTTRWRVRWSPSTAAMLDVAGIRGVTPEQAAEGVLRERQRRERDEGGPTAAQVLAGLRQAAECGLAHLVAERLDQVGDILPASGSLPELLAGLGLLDRLHAGHIPGLAAMPDATRPIAAELTAAAVRQIDGLAGSEEPADARALVELTGRADEFGGLRLTDALTRLAADGAPLMAAAAGAVRVLLGHDDADRFGVRVASWLDDATTPARRADLVRRLTGVLTAAGPLLAAGGEALEPLLTRIVALSDDDFLTRLPALRGGFDTLAPAARDRLLAVVEESLDDRIDTQTDVAPESLAAWASADIAGRNALTVKGLWPLGGQDDALSDAAPTAAPTAASATPSASPSTSPKTSAAATTAPAKTAKAAPPAPPHHRRATATQTGPEAPVTPPAVDASANTLTPQARWRLVLGRRTDPRDPRATRLGAALDELYGTGRGEGSRGDLGGGPAGSGGGREAAYPSVRDWAEDLAALFGPAVREEVLAAAVAAGRRDAITELDPDSARPSVDLLRAVLEHAGGLPESRIAALRPLVDRIVAELTRELATRLRPALSGVTIPRPSRRPGGGLDLPRTIRANLATARPRPGGGVTVVPEKPVFRTKARRSADWRLILVVDVSGSMEASTIWSALTASILAGVPALTTHFVAFSTEVIDFTDQVHDPLGLLLDVRVGGGTHIAAGLRYARELVTVPSRTLVAVVSDFEEGWPLGGLLGEVRTLVNSGCHVLGCASLDDRGKPRYSTAVAAQLVAAGMPVAALSPTELARWVGEKVR